MRAPPSGKILEVTVRRVRPNGDTYVFQRQTRYNPDRRYNQVISERLLYKIPKGSDEPVPTRPRKQLTKTPSVENPESSESLPQPGRRAASAPRVQMLTSSLEETPNSASNHAVEDVTATCERTGLLALLAFVGQAAGVDAAVKHAMAHGDALKAISIARYLVATDGGSLPAIEEWQIRHTLPYVEGITEDIYHDLFECLGNDETARQKLFISLCEGLEERDGIFYDSSTISTYGENIHEARYGFNKDQDGLPTIKLLAFYSLKDHRPLAYALQPGNVPDKISVPNALAQLECLHIGKYTLVTDTGFTSQDSLADYFRHNVKFLTLVSPGWVWVRDLVDQSLEQFEKLSSVVATDDGDCDVHGVTHSVFHEFAYQRQRNRGEHQAGEEEKLRRRVYVHVFYSASRYLTASALFKREMLDLKDRLEQGAELSKLDESRRDTFFKVTSGRGGQIHAEPLDDQYRSALKRKGIFVLVSNSIKDTSQALKCYRKREWIEGFFKFYKDKAGGSKTRVWSYEVLKGRIMVQFIAMCYYAWLFRKLGELRQTLGRPNGDPRHDLKQNLDQEKSLLRWINNKSLHQILLYFDCRETIQVRKGAKAKSWSTELTSRDRLFLRLLGMPERSM